MQPDVRNGFEQGIKIPLVSNVTDIKSFDIVLNSYGKHIIIITCENYSMIKIIYR